MSLFVAVLLSSSVSAQTVLFSEDFEDGDAANRWTVVEDEGTNLPDFAFDYVTSGLDAAPNGGGLGLKLAVNVDADNVVASRIFAVPTDETFSGIYTFSFDMWMNFEVDGDGTTEFALFGVKNFTANAGTLADNTGAHFSMTGDGGASKDISAYIDGAEETDVLGVYHSDSQNFSEYLDFYNEGIPGNQWLEVTIEVNAATVIFSINGNKHVELATAVTGANILVGLEDIWDSYGAANFVIYDNIKVTNDQVTGIADNQLERISYFPNPVQDILSVRNLTANSKIVITSLEGKELYKQTVSGTEAEINFASYPTGIYLLKLIENNSVRVEKIVKR